MKIFAIILVLLFGIGLVLADYKWRQWIRSRSRQCKAAPDKRR